MIFQLASDFAAALGALPEGHPRRRMLQLLEEALRRDIHFIGRHPTTLFQCMWNTCWWHDCPEGVHHYERPEGAEPPGRSQAESHGEKLHSLLDRWRAERERLIPQSVWLRSLRPPPLGLGSPMVAVLSGHEEGVTKVAFSPDGKRIASGSHDKTVRIWNVETGQQEACLTGHQAEIWSVAYAPDGRCVASASGDGTVRIWDTQAARELACLRGHEGEARDVTFSPAGSTLASGSADGTIRLWEVEAACEMARLERRPETTVYRGSRGRPLSQTVACVAYSPCGGFLVSGSGDHTVRVWDVASRKELGYLKGHRGWATGVAFSPDGLGISSASDDGGVRIWDFNSGELRACFQAHRKAAMAIAFSPDGRWLSTASKDETIGILPLARGRQATFLRGHRDWVCSIAYSPDGRYLASGSQDGTVRLWDLHRAPCGKRPRGHRYRVLCTAFSPDGRYAASGCADSSRYSAEYSSARSLLQIYGSSHCSPPDANPGPPGGQTVMVWESGTGRLVARLEGHARMVLCMAFSPDGRHLVSGSVDRRVHLWDVVTGKELARLQGHECPVTCLDFSPDGSLVVSGSGDQTARIWDTINGEEIARLGGDGGGVRSVAFSPDGRRLATASEDGRIRIWDMGGEHPSGGLREDEEPLESIELSRDGLHVLNRSKEGVLRVWDVRSGDCLRVMSEKDRAADVLAYLAPLGLASYSRGRELLQAVSFSPDGSWVLGHAEQGLLLVWDAGTGGGFRLIRDTDEIAARLDGRPSRFRLRPSGLESVLEAVATGRPVGWLPSPLDVITAHPCGRIWAGAAYEHFCLFSVQDTAEARGLAG